MSTQQAEDILKHTFKQLEKMLKDVRRQDTLSRRPHHPTGEKKAFGRSGASGSGKKKK